MESNVDQLMAKHGVTVDMVEGKSEGDVQQDESVSVETGGFGNMFSFDKVLKRTTREQLLRRVVYLEEHFHKGDIACSASPCANGGVCSVKDETYSCQCAGNYFGENCQDKDVDECSLGTDSCDKTTSYCVNSVGSFRCPCKDGFGDDTLGCSDVDECSLQTYNCGELSYCTNTAGSFKCTCQEGYAESGMGCAADACYTQPELFGAEVIKKSEDGMKITYGCKDDFKLREGNPTATCSRQIGV
ncbi:uromodulin-like [Gigantopelta aegis]|uniref:uromodulin-like n=1 Tax=Gigantopelta aegis TaxID=1735272 RepID=UPI001B887E41|nr:uromodulin-like [Gigantopelta aegis]